MDNDQTTTGPRLKSRRGAAAVGLLAAGALAGGILAGTLSASAADNSSTAPSTGGSTATAPSTTDGRGHGDGRFGGPGGGRSDEKVLTGDNAAKAKAAALKAVPGGTVVRVETDAGDAAYEAHMTKADGTRVTVKLDKAFALVKAEDGMGLGDPRPPGDDDLGDSSTSSSGA